MTSSPSVRWRRPPLRLTHSVPIVLAMTVCLLFAFSSTINPLVPVSGASAVSDLFASLFNGYDNQLRPYLNTSQPVVINTALRINLLYNVDSKEETFQLDLFVNEYWTDPRLQFNASKWYFVDALRVPTRYTPWLPDTFFFNAIKCQSIADQSILLSADGTVFWSRHQSCTFHSSFDLLSFPFDHQILAVRRTSFSYTDTELLLNFLTGSGWRPDPQIDFTNSLWDFEYAFSNRSSLQFINTHSANAYLAVARKSTAYIVKMVLPMFLLTLLSSGSYLVDPGSPPARVGFSVALILSIVTFNSVVAQDLPKINYATMIDWYVWYCFLFVVIPLGEYAFVNNIIVSKKYGPEMPYLVDDFCMWTAPLTWIVINLWYWPLYTSPAIHIILAVVWSGWMALNVYRVFWWNRLNTKRGLWEPTKALYRHLRTEYRHWRHPDEFPATRPRTDSTASTASSVSEEKEAQLKATIELAATTGQNVFELPLVPPPATSSTLESSTAFSSHAGDADVDLYSGTPIDASASDEPNPFDEQPLLHHDHDSALGEESTSGQQPSDEEYLPESDYGQQSSDLNLV